MFVEEVPPNNQPPERRRPIPQRAVGARQPRGIIPVEGSIPFTFYEKLTYKFILDNL